MTWSGLWMRARALHRGQRFLLALAALVAAASGTRMLLLRAARTASCAVAGTHSDSLLANRMRLAGIDRLLTRYDLSQADRISVQLERRRKASAAEVMELDSARVHRNAFEDSLLGNARREPEEAPPTYSLDNPFTQRARVVRSLDALKQLGAGPGEVEAFLDQEGLTPLDGDPPRPGRGTAALHAPGTFAAARGSDARRLLEAGPGDSASKIDPRFQWHDTSLIARRLRGYRTICSAYRREMTLWLALLLGSVCALVAGWWLVMRPGRIRQAPR